MSQPRRTENRIAQALAWLRELEQHSPRKHSQRWVVVPQALAFGSSPLELALLSLDDPALQNLSADGHPARCPACRFATLKGRELGQHDLVSTQDPRPLSRGRGLPLKVLLVVYRWARPYARVPRRAPAASYEHQAIARLKVAAVADEVLVATDRSQLPPSAADRAISRSLRTLEQMRLIESLEDRGRGRANFYAAHSLEPVVRAPAGLWKNGWLKVLSGAALVVLLRLFAAQQHRITNARDWARASDRFRQFAERGRLLVDISDIHGPGLPERSLRAGLQELQQYGLVAEVRTRHGIPNLQSNQSVTPDFTTHSGIYIVLLDPELLHPPVATVESGLE